MSREGLLAVSIAVVSLFGGREAEAVVVAGANGGGNTSNNTTASQMEAQLGIGDASFYNNVLKYSDATAVYLGWANTINGPRAYALSAMHITFANTMVINGHTYNVTRTSISSSDLALLTLTQANGIMPPYGALTLASSTPSDNTNIIMAGWGRNRTQDATTDANTSDAVPVTSGTGYTTTSTKFARWGTNQTSNFPGNNPTTTININGNPTTVTQTIFNQPPSGQWLTTNEAQAVNGDSGGAMFDFNGNLLGIMIAVSSDSVNGTQAFFTQSTFFADIPTYKTAIETAIGQSLIPEPSTTLLIALALASAGVLHRRRAIPRSLPASRCVTMGGE